MENHLSLLSEPHDSLRKGLPAEVGQLNTPMHPVEEMQKHKEERFKQAKIRALTAQYGLANAMKYQADSHLLAQFHRMPGIPSSFHGLQILEGKDTTIEVEDYLGDQEQSAEYFCDFHATMEHKLKM